jgi:excisionase family DNA binding protein
LTWKQVCYRLNIGKNTLDRWVKAGKFPPPITGPYFNSTRKWPEWEVDAWMEAQELYNRWTPPPANENTPLDENGAD